ncbi:MAG: 16S rRNA (guanine(966)-N(2))-methyltransferase RsmD [Flavobacteriaceae bacterium]|nr:16S rRNA (guanine(966)-N(2))-methyltransferase RsmD [Flavobacteriaceae bacterium]
MRIISGIYKGKRLQAPKKLPVRPTTDMAKEALFNILNNYYYFDEIEVLDLFAGTGSISFEFASRSCPKIVAVDQHKGCVRFISEIAHHLEAPVQAIQANVFGFLEKHLQSYDLIFADPPYHFELADYQRIVTLSFSNKLLSNTGTLIVEHPKQTKLDKIPHYWETRSYGGSSFSFFDWEHSN